MRKFLFPMLIALLTVILCLGAAANTIYLSDNGTGDGLTKETATNDIEYAIQSVAMGGTVIITDTYTLNEPFTEPYHDGIVTFTGGKMIFNHPKTSRYYRSGPTTFEKMTFTYGSANTAKSGMFVCRFNPIVFGSGLTTNSLTVVGGYQDPNNELEKTLDSSITINSGTFATIVGFSRGNGTVNFRGTSHITVNGGTVKNLYGASIHGSYSGSTEIVINGGTVSGLFTGGDSTRRLNGDAKVTVNGGTVATLNINNVMGHTDVYYLGGKINGVIRTTADDIINYVTDGTASLFVRKGIIANEYIEFFDSALYDDGSKISSAGDAEVAVYSVLDKKPEKSRATSARVYVSNAGNGDGLTPETAISDMKVAFEMLEGIDGTIVLINMVPFDAGSFYEPEHENHIVITSYDGERYFDGGIDFCGEKLNRYYYSGNTTIENTKITLNSSPLFIGRWHDITFGTGIEVAANKLYVVGGYQFPSTENINTKCGGSITVESGSYYCLIGYTRGTNAENPFAFNGTQTINVLGGDVYRIYGGPAQANSGDNVVINIDGGNVTDFIQIGGDQFYYSNSATVNIKSGSVKKLDMHNVINSTTINWTGGTVGQMLISYGQQTDKESGNVLFDVAPLAANAKYTLNYSGVEPTAEMLALFNTVASGTPTEKTEVKMTIGDTVGYINGEAKTLDAAPIIRESRTMLPVRFVAEAFGAKVGWDGATSTATVTTADVEIKIVIGSNVAYINGAEVALDAPAFIENGRTYMPVRFVAENLGATVGWDGATSTATLTK